MILIKYIGYIWISYISQIISRQRRWIAQNITFTKLYRFSFGSDDCRDNILKQDLTSFKILP